MKNFQGTKRRPQKYQSILRANDVQPVNCSSEILATFVPRRVKSGPGNKGAPSKVASSIFTWLKDWSRLSLITTSSWAISLHLVMFSAYTDDLCHVRGHRLYWWRHLGSLDSVEPVRMTVAGVSCCRTEGARAGLLVGHPPERKQCKNRKIVVTAGRKRTDSKRQAPEFCCAQKPAISPKRWKTVPSLL